MARKILISQQAPQGPVSPYAALIDKYGVTIDYKPFFLTESLSAREFRAEHVNVLDYSAIVFSAKTTIDAFFKLCEETRVKVPETMKYFCTTENVAKYLQKHIVYRKRKIFFGEGTPESIISQVGTKHAGEKFLVAASSNANSSLAQAFIDAGLETSTCVFVKQVQQDITSVDLSSYDAIVLYNTADVTSLLANFPDFKQGDTKFITFGKSIVKAMEDAGLSICISAPTPEVPSVGKAIENFLEGRF